MILDKHETTFPPRQRQLYNISYEAIEAVGSFLKPGSGSSTSLARGEDFRVTEVKISGTENEAEAEMCRHLREAGHSFLLPKSLVTQSLIPEWDLQI